MLESCSDYNLGRFDSMFISSFGDELEPEERRFWEFFSDSNHGETCTLDFEGLVSQVVGNHGNFELEDEGFTLKYLIDRRIKLGSRPGRYSDFDGNNLSDRDLVLLYPQVFLAHMDMDIGELQTFISNVIKRSSSSIDLSYSGELLNLLIY